MPPEEPLSKSPLDKPLQQLTEDDISQLTREDCRRYLKEKGMRRPSWNKSQAIQQVISLKTLLEPPTSDSDSAAGTCNKRYIPRPRFDNLNNNNNNNKNDNPSLNSATRGTSADAEVSESAEEAVPYEGGKDVEKPDVSGRLLVGDSDSTPPRNTGSSNTPVGQMTIFYCGRVNVYDDVPADKAQALLHLAASPLHLPQEPLIDRSLALLSTRHLQATSVKASPDSAVILLPNTQTVKMNESTRLHGEEYKFPEDNPAILLESPRPPTWVEGNMLALFDVPASRKASVQRYLEKKKDRFKSKRKVGTTPTTSLDVYLNHQMGHQFPNEHPSRTDPCSPPQIRPSNTPIRCSSMENNLTGNANFSAGIKNKDVKK